MILSMSIDEIRENASYKTGLDRKPLTTGFCPIKTESKSIQIWSILFTSKEDGKSDTSSLSPELPEWNMLQTTQRSSSGCYFAEAKMVVRNFFFVAVITAVQALKWAGTSVQLAFRL